MREEMKTLFWIERCEVLKTANECDLLGDEDIASALQERGYEASVYSMPYHRRLVGISCVADRWKEYQQERKRKDGKKKILS